MSKTSLIVALTLGMGTLVVLPPLAEAGVVVQVAPPDPRVEVVPDSPYEGAVWTPGYYNWRHNRHEWVSGHYVRGHRGRTWEPHHWTQHGHGWRLERGHWR